MLPLTDHLLAAVIVAIPPVWAVSVAGRRLRRAPAYDLPAARRFVYVGTIVLLWTLSAFVVAVWVSALVAAGRHSDSIRK